MVAGGGFEPPTFNCKSSLGAGHGRLPSGFVFPFSDCVALYLYYCAVLLFSYYDVPFLSYCVERGLIPARLEVWPRTPSPMSSLFLRQGGFSVGEGVSLPRPRIQVVHGTAPQKCARNALPARSGILCHPAIAGLRCHPLPTSSTHAPEVTPN